MTAGIPKGATLGIVGGGQLGRMMARAARVLGYRSHVWDALPGPGAPPPAAQESDRFSHGMDDAVIQSFIVDSAAFLCEFENIPSAVLQRLAKTDRLFPNPTVIQTGSSRIKEKELFAAVGRHFAPWCPVTGHEDLTVAIDRIAPPGILKTVRLGYDGKGQALVATKAEKQQATALIGDHVHDKGVNGAEAPFIFEKKIAFDREISVIIVRNQKGETRTFGPIENIHKEHVLRLSIYPARILEKVHRDALAAALAVAEALNLCGILTVEMFVSGDRVFLNEIAPRPHNSGHWTIEACPVSQFGMFVRSACGLPLGDPRPRCPAAMVNLLGARIDAADRIGRDRHNKVHVYGKKTALPGRKMGHVTRLFPDFDRGRVIDWAQDIAGEEWNVDERRGTDGQ